MMPGVTLASIRTNGICLNVAQAGPATGALVLLLHGFPEFWYGWRKQIPALAEAGYRVWAPDQRGYNASDKPPHVRDYTLDRLADDAAGLIAAAGRQRAIVVGHDWGAAVAWWLAARHPQLVERLIVLNVPHPLVMRRLLLSRPRQMLRSWYILAFQLPWLPEALARRGNWHAVIGAMRASSRNGTFTEDDFAHYRQAWSQPGAYTAMLNWYRATFRHSTDPPRHGRIEPRTLILWGARDRFLIREGAERSLQLCDRVEAVYYDEATHWLQHEEADDVNRRILAFCREA